MASALMRRVRKLGGNDDGTFLFKTHDNPEGQEMTVGELKALLKHIAENNIGFGVNIHANNRN